ncbi:MAG: S26 family signal peptidase [Candidatus Omnitrophica bacterium]|nr:S26 family signal peptidase [Candidatus Omnitrophota bacterium]
MFPTFRPGDLLHITVYSRFDEIRIGDSVIYNAPGGCKTVHRVISVEGTKIRTQGDNNSFQDPYLLSFSDLVGRVDWMERKKKRIKVRSGFYGKIWHRLMQARRTLWRVLFLFARPIYCKISDFFSFVAITPKNARCVIYYRPWGRELQVIVNNRTIAKRNPETGKSEICLPYRLLYGAYLKKHGFELTPEARNE